MITIKKMSELMIDDIVNLWNLEVVNNSIYDSFTKDRFKKVFLENPNYDSNGSLVYMDNDNIFGFGNACYKKGDSLSKTGYINILFIKKEYQRKGFGTKLLHSLEQFLKDNGKTLVRNYFGSPINLRWIIPGYKDHIHPGAPAIPFNSPYYFLLLANGYKVDGQHDGFHINLDNFIIPDSILKKINDNEKEGYNICYYDKNKHFGFEEMFDALNNSGFKEAIYNELSKEKPDPLLIVEKNGEILGFTGPVRTDETGRAYLAGVAIHPKAQARGLGKTMFCKLCDESKKNGAKYMTLFTGTNNPARNIYLYAGLKIVQSFVVMRKDLNNETN